jgi:PIN domain nuclease of toxin-antitoxin system
METVVLDASALLAFLLEEDGYDKVAVENAVLSTINFAEVAQRLIKLGHDVTLLTDELIILGIQLEPFGIKDALTAAQLQSNTQNYGLSLGDRACLALAKRLDTVAVTADRVWQVVGQSIGVNVQFIR